ncbi:hypothetical protein RCL1_001522 [Eukaryota sp. TZLM3-RCL]
MVDYRLLPSGKTLIGKKITHSQNAVYEGQYSRKGGWEHVILKEYPNITNHELEALKQCNHENVVEMIDIDKSDGNHVYLILEKCDMDLDAYLSTYKPSKKIKISILKQIVAGISYIHGRNITHSDLKPSNILINVHENGLVEAKLADFGGSRQLSSDDATRVNTMNATYTPGYRAPESFPRGPFDKPFVSLEADIFALGIIAHELLTGTHPFDFEGINERDKNVYYNNRVSSRFDSLLEENFVNSCLVYDRKDRPTIQLLVNHPLVLSSQDLGDFLCSLFEHLQCTPLVHSFNFYNKDMPGNWLLHFPREDMAHISATLPTNNREDFIRSMFGLLKTFRNFKSHDNLQFYAKRTPRLNTFEYFNKHFPLFIFNVVSFYTDCLVVSNPGTVVIPKLFIYRKKNAVLPANVAIHSAPSSAPSYVPSVPIPTPPPSTTTAHYDVSTPVVAVRRVSSASSSSSCGGSTNIKVSSLPPTMSATEFAMFVSKFGPLKAFKSPENSSYRIIPGVIYSTGYADFCTERHAKLAVEEINRLILEGSYTALSASFAKDRAANEVLPSSSPSNCLYIKHVPVDVTAAEFLTFAKNLRGDANHQFTKLYDAPKGGHYKSGVVCFGNEHDSVNRLTDALERLTLVGVVLKGCFVSACYYVHDRK